MKRKKVLYAILSGALVLSSCVTAFAKTPERKLPAVQTAEKDGGSGEASKQKVSDEEASETEVSETEASEQDEETVLRNTIFTTASQMREMMGTDDPSAWSVRYLSQVEQYYWNFSAPGEEEKREMSMNLVSNSYQNLEMFLDNGYLLDYEELAEYADDYLARKGEEDAYYKVLTDCLNNPYLLNKPKARVTDTTYNDRDYSAVFDPDYYYDNNPDLQRSIGFQPPELLRHFVEKGIAEGRRGNAAFDIDTYIAYTDGEILLATADMAAPGVMPAVAKYSYSRANYYGKLLGHYDYSALFAPGEDTVSTDSGEEIQIDW